MEGGENPVKLVREQLGLTQRKAADKIGCHYQTVYMAEHGMFIPIPPVILQWVASELGGPREAVEHFYKLFQLEQRDAACERHGLKTLSLDCLGLPGEHPIQRLRGFLGLNQSQFCKQLCIPVVWLYEAEKKALTFPHRLRVVLEDIGIPKVVLSEIAERYESLSDD